MAASTVSKIHALVDTNGMPVAIALTPGRAHAGRSALPLIGRIGPGEILLADRASASDAIRQRVEDRGAWANIKPLDHRVERPTFSAFLYRYNLVERFFNKLEHFRALATRFEKPVASYLALLKLACARICMRLMRR